MRENKPLQVAVVVETIPKVSETFVLNHITGLIDAGAEVSVFAYYKEESGKIHPSFHSYQLAQKINYKPGMPGPFIKRIRAAIAVIKKIRKQCPSFLFKALNVFKYGAPAFKLHLLYEGAAFISTASFDLVHCHFGTMANRFLRYRKMGLLNAPLVVSFHGIDMDSPEAGNPAFYRELKKTGKLFIANSEFSKKKLLQLGFTREKIRVIPVSLDLQAFKRVERKTKTASEPVIFITVARFIKLKGIEYSIKAIRDVIQSGYRNVRYRVIGEGPEQENLENLVKESGIGEYVSFTGALPQNQVINELEQADIFLLNGIRVDGREETQGLVIQEAQAMGLPVIVSNIGGVAEGLTPDVSGFVVPPGNTGAIVEKMIVLINDPAKRIAMGREGRLLVEKKFSNKQSTIDLLACYKEIISDS